VHLAGAPEWLDPVAGETDDTSRGKLGARAARVSSAGREEPLRTSAAGCQATTESLMDASSAAVEGRSRRRHPWQKPAAAERRFPQLFK